MRASPLVRAFTPFPMWSTDHLDRFFNHYLPQITTYNEATVLWTCTKHDPTTSTCSDPKTRPSSLGLTSKLLTKLTCHILSTRRRQRLSNTISLRISSAFIGHASEPHSSINLTVTTIQPLIDNRISRRRDRCIRMVNASWVFCLLNSISCSLRLPD